MLFNVERKGRVHEDLIPARVRTAHRTGYTTARVAHARPRGRTPLQALIILVLKRMRWQGARIAPTVLSISYVKTLVLQFFC